MCYEVKCSSCGKTSWGGCGKHVQSVYEKVPEPQRCLCKAWPGVVVVDSTNPTAPAAQTTTTSSPSSSRCTIM